MPFKKFKKVKTVIILGMFPGKNFFWLDNDWNYFCYIFKLF